MNMMTNNRPTGSIIKENLDDTKTDLSDEALRGKMGDDGLPLHPDEYEKYLKENDHDYWEESMNQRFEDSFDEDLNNQEQTDKAAMFFIDQSIHLFLQNPEWTEY